MKPTLIKISISQDGLLPQKSIELGEAVMQNFPKKLMSALDFEKVDDEKKRTTFIGIIPVFVVIGEKTQEIEMELTVTHPELRDKVVDIFTAKPAESPAPADGAKPAPASAASKSAKSPQTKKPSAPAKKPVKPALKSKTVAKKPASKTAPKTVSKPAKPAKSAPAAKKPARKTKPAAKKKPASGKPVSKSRGGKSSRRKT